MNARGQWFRNPAIFCFVAVCLALFVGGVGWLHAATPKEQNSPLVVELKLDREVEPVLATYIDEGLADAARRQAALVLITMDTPGGLSDSMTDMIHHILESPVPVAVFVSPAGARGASAGFFILLSADVAAMAPGTRTGASTPILLPGGFSVPVDEVLRKKINNDATAFLRSFTEKRNRNPKLAETSVTDAQAFTENEALAGHLIDLIASDNADLLKQLNGREIKRFDGKAVKLSLENYRLDEFRLSARQKFLARIVDPDVFFLLLLVGVLGLYTEFTHPGVVAPGVIGGISAVLALYAMHLLPVNFAGVVLILLAFALFILEAKFASHGVLLVGGVVSMFLGAIFLIRSPLTPGGVSLGVALSVTVPVALLTVFLMRLVLKSRRWKTATGREEMLGAEGVVTMPLPAEGEGMIRVHGELWRAAASAPVPEGALVRVTRVDGLKLFVEPKQA
ncbi:MAG TPA: nodulation protein NfeD [Candidatus Acidoferrales bacterium]|jgi:membrane-bound serine protease (ClpP class)|nr:nodulation protein NfeD [Candidatus Acidoferrales bacterium]